MLPRFMTTITSTCDSYGNEPRSNAGKVPHYFAFTRAGRVCLKSIKRKLREKESSALAR